MVIPLRRGAKSFHSFKAVFLFSITILGGVATGCDASTSEITEPACFDGVQDGNESDVDCGGDCASCQDGLGCIGATDCESGRCVNNVCEMPVLGECTTGLTRCGVDAIEACVEGFWTSSSPCLAPFVCEQSVGPARCVDPTTAANCAPDEVADGSQCRFAMFEDRAIIGTTHCDNSEQDGDETGVDCGGSCMTCLSDASSLWSTTHCPTSRFVVAGVECAWIRVPIDWEDKAFGTMVTFVARHVVGAAAGPALMKFGGGPHARNYFLPNFGAVPSWGGVGLDMYTPEFRGVAYSSHITCAGEDPDSESGSALSLNELAACARELAAWNSSPSLYEGVLNHINITQTAKDQIFLSKLIRQLGSPSVYSVGGSGGTLQTYRILQIDDSAIDAAGMIGTTNAKSKELCTYSDQWQEAGFALLTAASTTDFVRTKWPEIDAPATTFGSFRHVIDNVGLHCPALFDSTQAGWEDAVGWRAYLAAVAGSTLLTMDPLPGVRDQFFVNFNKSMSTVFRARRCNSDDVDVLHAQRRKLQDPPIDRSVPPQRTSLMTAHQFLGEMANDPSCTTATVLPQYTAAYLANASSLMITLKDEGWPVFPQDGYHDADLNTSTPLLIVNGRYDPATVVQNATDTFQSLSGGNGKHVLHIIERGAHGAEPCQLDLLRQFFANPDGVASIDASCAAVGFSPRGDEFMGSAEQAWGDFERLNYWGGNEYQLMFVSSGVFDPAQGVAAADALCNADYPGAVAYLSTENGGAIDAVAEEVIIYNTLAGGPQPMASHAADLTDGNLWSAPDYRLDGTQADTYVWTGTQIDGTASADLCADVSGAAWSASTGNGAFGHSAYTDFNWSSSGSAVCAAGAYPVYCVVMPRAN